MATCIFRSPLAYRLQCFLETRRRAGRRSVSCQKILLYLDRFLVRELQPGETITREIAERWIQSLETLSIGTRINRISMLRQFCLYLAYFDPRTCVVHRSFLPHRTRPAPYIYTRKEVRQIMVAARRLGPRGSLRPAVISNLVGLLYTTGLRIGEALKLTLGDVDLKRRVLLVRATKFKKTRNVPVSATTVRQLQIYLRQRRRARRSLLISVEIVTGKPRSPRPFWKSSGSLAYASRRASAVPASMTFGIRLPSIVCWHGIAKGPIFRPSCHCYQLISATPQYHARKYICTPPPSCWRVSAGGFIHTSRCRR